MLPTTPRTTLARRVKGPQIRIWIVPISDIWTADPHMDHAIVVVVCLCPERLIRTLLGAQVIACLDIRSNDDGDLVVTKGQSYDVREKTDAGEDGAVRNLG